MPTALALALAAALAAGEPGKPAPDAPAPVPAAASPASSGTEAPADAAPPVSLPPPDPEPPALPDPHAGDDDPLLRTYVIERIELRGLRHAREREVRRRLFLDEGDLLDDEDVLLSRLRLLQLGWFSRIETRVERGSSRGRVVLVFELVERNTVIVSDLVFGSTRPQPFYAGLGLSQQNFLGRGLGLSGAFVYGGTPDGRPEDPARFAVRAGFFAPDVTARGLPRLVLGAGAVFLRGEELACEDPDCDGYSGRWGDAPRVRYERAGGELTAGFRPGPFERLLATWRWERLDARTPGAGAGAIVDPPAILPGVSHLSSLTWTWELETRDDPFYPQDGLRASAQVTLGSELLGGDYEYSRYLAQLETAFGLFGAPLRFQGAVGVAQGGAPFFERLYAADWSYFTVGPALGRALELNFSTDSRYDAFLGMGGLEWGRPLWSRGRLFTRGYVAVGVRAVYSTATLGGPRTRASRLPFSTDVALRFDTPFGDFNASLGYLLDNGL
jgi:hypothetical protein